jgi:hypothetical protein
MGRTRVRAVLRRRKRDGGDFFKRSVSDRRSTEDETPWFLAEDDGPELEVEAGISSNLEDGEQL